MSNKIVPTIYRCVIDDVIHNIKNEFDEFGVSEDVLAELQHKWENKVMASHVADFDAPHLPVPQHHAYAPHPMHMIAHPHYPPPHNPYGPPHQPQPPGHSHIKAEPADPRYILSAPPGMAPYAIPALPGPQLNGTRPPHPGGQQGVLSFPPGPPAVKSVPAVPPRLYPPTLPPSQPTQTQTQQQAPAHQPQPQSQRIQQVDGPSSSSSESPSPPPSQPQSSVQQSSQATSSTAQPDDPEAINSDLDDSDTEGEEEAEEGGFTENDIVFCTYDKVARVKNKWKCILKDGMIHINGRDYLFAKCTGEFEW